MLCLYTNVHVRTYVYTYIQYISVMHSAGTSHLPHSVGWCSSPSEVELALETTFTRDKKRFQYADVNHDGGVDNKEFIYFLHPEYNKEAVRGEGRCSEFVCVCVCVCARVCSNGCTYVYCGDSPVWLFQESHPSPSDDITGRRPHKETGRQPWPDAQ